MATKEEVQELIERSIANQEEKLKIYINAHVIPRIESTVKQELSLSTPSQQDSEHASAPSPTVSYKRNDLSISYGGDEEISMIDEDDDDFHSIINNTDSDDLFGDNEDIVKISLDKDSYSIMMVSRSFSIFWWLSFAVFALQITLFSMILEEQIVDSGDTIFNVPSSVKPKVLVGQFLAILVLFTIQDDIIGAIKICTIFFAGEDYRALQLNAENINSFLFSFRARPLSVSMSGRNSLQRTQIMAGYWNVVRRQVLLPNGLKFIQGIMALTTSFIIVISSEGLIELFMNFSALSIISYIDNVSYKLCEDGILGFSFVRKTEKVEVIELKRQKLKKGQVPLQTIIVGVLVIVLYSIWGYFAQKQASGVLFHKVFPGCLPKTAPLSDILEIGDGKCQKRANKVECGFDNGDCDDFNMAYPRCEGDPELVLDKKTCNSDPIYMTPECGYDNGACCKDLFDDTIDQGKLGDGICNEYPYNSRECQWDGGDCVPDLKGCNVANAILVGNGNCNWNDIGYNTKECGWDNGDCLIPGYPDCHTDLGDDPTMIGDGSCDEKYNIPECGFDDGDCCFETVGSDTDKVLLNNGICNAQFNIPQCLYDKGDCDVPNLPDCHVDDPRRIGDGQCDGGKYNTKECNFDNGDCKVAGLPDCITDKPNLVGNGICEDFDGMSDSNKKECNYDNGDCRQVNISNGIIDLDLAFVEGFISFDHVYGYGISARKLSSDDNLWVLYDSSSKLGSSHNIKIGSLRSNKVYAKTSIDIGDELRISHIIKPSSQSSYLYQSSITFENLSENETFTDLGYNRSIKWNPSEIDGKDCLSMLSLVPSSLVEVASSKYNATSTQLAGFIQEESSNTSSFPSLNGSSFTSFSSGLNDDETYEIYALRTMEHDSNGETLQFEMKNNDGSARYLNPGETFSFDVFDGIAFDIDSAYNALSSTNSEKVYVGYKSTSDDECTIHNLTASEIFLLGFRGVGEEPIPRRNSQTAAKVNLRYNIAGISQFTMVDTFDMMPSLFYFQNYENETNVTIPLEVEGHLSVKKGVTYTFCISSGNEVSLRIDSRLLRMKTSNYSSHTARTQCYDVLAVNTVLMVSVEYIWTQEDFDLPLVLQWEYLEEPQTIIPSTAWVQDPTIYEAENVESQGTHIGEKRAGYSGYGYITLFDPDSFIEWDITIESTQEYSVQFRYWTTELPLPTNTSRQLDVIIDGSDRNQIKVGTEQGSYSSWLESEPLLIPFSVGNHSIRLQSRGTDNLYIDFMRITEKKYTLNPVADAFIRDGDFKSTNFGKNEDIKLRKGKKRNHNRVGLLDFNTSTVEVGSKAYLYIYISEVEGFFSREVTIRRLISTATWDEETVTFVTFNFTNYIDKDGPSFDVKTSNKDSWFPRIDITDLLQSDKLLLLLEVTSTATGQNFFAFKSRESSGYSPYIEVFPLGNQTTIAPSPALLNPSTNQTMSPSLPSSGVTFFPSQNPSERVMPTSEPPTVSSIPTNPTAQQSFPSQDPTEKPSIIR